MENKKTVVIGASMNIMRYSNRAVVALKANGHDVVAIGRDTGDIEGVEIQHGHPPVEDVHTVTMYLSAMRQPDFYDYILGLNPKRIIFNPGAENPELELKAKKQGIYVDQACSLVLLRIHNY